MVGGWLRRAHTISYLRLMVSTRFYGANSPAPLNQLNSWKEKKREKRGDDKRCDVYGARNSVAKGRTEQLFIL
jgi:hypothetical protein